ncbi:MAG: hypothetical protein WAO69_12120 [Aestuariivita sp.]|uniref:hypothetical protein n=1 Tax=Aestuariivita sp. TaxID=1872407 RepID=UPI003BB16FCA
MYRALSAAFLILFAGAAWAEMTVQLVPPWDGKKVPAGQQCSLHGGKGSTPPMKVTGLPQGTAYLVVEYNDKDYRPLSRKGGHGTLGYPVKGSSANLPAVPGMTDKLPGGVTVVRKAQSTGQYASSGYLPPCSGGRGNRYFAVIQAVGSDGKVIEKASVDIGRY